MMNTRNLATPLGALLGAALLGLTGCAAADPAPDSVAPAAEAITVEDAWVKAADSGMTAGFGTIDNASDADVTVVSVASASSPMMELHETVANESGESVMREIEGGFVIPANGHLHLEPAGNHIMMMDLPAPILAGDDVTFTLTFSDDSTLEFDAVVKDYAGANESYEGGGEHGDGTHGDDGHEGAH